MMVKRALVLSGLLVALSLLLVSAVDAHALLVRSIPAANADLSQAPATLELWFSEALEAGFSSARVLDATGQAVPVGSATVDVADVRHLSMPLETLPPGIYTVAWRTLSRVDGHEWYGSFPFTILNPDGSRPDGTATNLSLQTRSELPTPLQALARWLALVGGVLFCGSPLFLVVAGRAIEDIDIHTQLMRLVVQCLGLATLLVVVGSWLNLAQQASQLDAITQLPRLIYGTRLGILALARQLGVIAGWLSVMLLTRSQPLTRRTRILMGAGAIYAVGLALLIVLAGLQGEGFIALVTLVVVGSVVIYTGRTRSFARPTQPWLMVLSVGAIALGTFSLGSHAGAVSGSGWALLGDYVHLLAAAAWLGGLILLPLLIGALDRSGQEINRAELWPLIYRYSYLASFAVFGLIVTGVFSGLIQLPTLASLVNTTYGRVLLIKLIVIAALMGVALLNNRLVHRRAQYAEFVTRFRRQVAVESIGGLWLLVVVAVFVQTQPARDAALSATADVPFSTVIHADDLVMQVQVSPNRPGENRFQVRLSHADDTSIGEVQLVRLIFNYRDAELGQATADLPPQSPANFVLDGAYLTQAGRWAVAVYVRRRGLDDVIGRLTLNVPGPIASANLIEPWQNPLPALSGAGWLAVLLIVLGVMPFLWPRWVQRIKRAALVLGGLCLGAGIVIGVPVLPEFMAQFSTVAPAGFTQTATIDQVQLTLHVTPAQPGNNEFLIEVADPRTGGPGQVLLNFTMLDMEMGRLQTEASPIDSTHYLARGDFLGMGGRWQIEVTLRRPGLEDVRYTFDANILRPIAP